MPGEHTHARPARPAPRRRRRLFWLAAAGLLATLGFAALNYRPIASRAVTWLALSEARGKVVDFGSYDQTFERVIEPLADRYGPFFRRGLIDRDFLVQSLPAEAVTPECAPVWGVIFAYYHANEESFDLPQGPEPFLEELRAWLDPVLRRSASREALVHLLASDYTLFSKASDRDGGPLKQFLLNCLFSVGRETRQVEWLALETPCLAAVKDSHWQAILRDCEHPREKVRAGAILLLHRHPSRMLFLGKARRALGDPSAWVRLAAAGALALNGDSSGADDLLAGLDHERWEVRYWCALGLKTIGKGYYRVALERERRVEPDSWVAAQLGGFLKELKPAFPDKEWETCRPLDAGLDPAALRAFEAHVGGRGCVVRYGYVAHAWGDPAQRGDVASASKPLYTHFLLAAIEEKRLGSVYDPVSRFEPGLKGLNAALGHKDAAITWRDLANQISCYGVSEEPAKAFDYNDCNMALFFDTLVHKVYGARKEDVDKHVLHARLTDILGCQDNPTFFAFGFDDRPGRVGISVRDFARFGLLYLRNGEWNGRRILHEMRIELALKNPLPNAIPRTQGKPAEMLPGQRSIGGGSNQTDHLGSYSFAWWTNGADRDGQRHWPGAPLDAYGAFGHGGMRALVIIPSLELVACWNDSPNEGREKESEALRLLAKVVVAP